MSARCFCASTDDRRVNAARGRGECSPGPWSACMPCRPLAAGAIPGNFCRRVAGGFGAEPRQGDVIIGSRRLRLEPDSGPVRTNCTLTERVRAVEPRVLLTLLPA